MKAFAYVTIGCMYVILVRAGVDHLLTVLGHENRLVNLGAVIVVVTSTSSAALIPSFLTNRLDPVVIGAVSGISGYVFYYVIHTQYDPLFTLVSIVSDGYSLLALCALVGLPPLLGFARRSTQKRILQQS